MTDPTARRDQVKAAVVESLRMFLTLGATVDRPEVAYIPDGTPTGRRLTEWQNAEWVAGCEHAAEPCALAGLLADPGRCYCLGCIGDAARAHSKANPDTCDACGKVTASFHEVFVNVPPVTVLSGHTCTDCHRLDTAGE